MLQQHTVYPTTLGLLKKLMAVPELSEYNLARGTALSLQIGHRISVDLDFFGSSEIDTISILDTLNDLAKVKIINQSKAIIILNVDGVKVDIVRYRYPLINPIGVIEDIRLLSLLDIGTIKLAAITNRGRKRDFFDLFFLLRTFSLEHLLEAYKTKYADGSEFLVQKSITYFEDAEDDDMPMIFDKEITWSLETVLKHPTGHKTSSFGVILHQFLRQ